MQTIKVNGLDIQSSHEVKTNEQTHHTEIHVTFEGEGKSITHVMTIGSADEPLPSNYDQAALQKDLDTFREKHAALFESKLRAANLAANLN
jgi:hypothetical protein